MLSLNQRERRVSRLNRTGKNTTGWARRLTALLVTACLVMAMALPVYAEVDLLPDAPDEVELLEDEQGTASGEDTALPEQNAATPVPDAATPEPEQSAEPEQPAPTETPEPTAEPTPTPEPAATATATPVPTVTPTATPEPTEQPQKMYAATSVDNVQAVSEGGVPDTYTLYFAVPKTWIDYTGVKIYAIDGTDKNSNKRYELAMKEDSKTDDGRKIYSAVLNKAEHYQYGGLGGLEFRGYKGDKCEDTVIINKVVDKDSHDNLTWMSFKPGDQSYIGGNYYDGKNGNGWDPGQWEIFTVSHKYFADKPMAFENKTSEKLTNVKAWFYELDTNKNLTPVSEQPISLDDIQPNSTATVTIPDDFCSYVQFTWNEGNSTKSSKIYNFYGESVSGDDKSFTYSDTSNCFIYTGANNERWGIEKSVLIYYDATFSKLPTTGEGDAGGNYSIPKADPKADPKANQSTVYYRLKGETVDSIGGTMSRIEGTDYYAADVPDGYTEIVFSSYPLSDDKNLANCGNSTGWETIPTDYKVTERCFYADTNDDAVYGKGQRGGYWAPKGTPRDAETWKKTTIVDIKPANFTEEANTKYVTSTLYDYYTDYELNGKNRDSYDRSSPAVSYRNWVPFREFDQALSDYYQAAKAQYPLYTGHFQPSYSDWGFRFDAISAALNLWGLNSAFKNENRFMAINNSTINEEGNGTRYDYAYQGLVADTTSTGKATSEPLLKDTKVAEPHFDEAFLSGTNTKNAKLGNVYNNVAFPFTKKAIFDEDQGVDYWYFDSQDTTLYLKQDTEQDQYFLKSSTDEQEREKSRNLESNSTSKTITKNDKTVSSYGYFPFNETATGGVASTYNYGFGTKLQMDFTLTDDGMVETNKIGEDNKKVKTNIKFFFSGDDDVWVFIDGKLALDVGGAHGKVFGLLEFGETKDGKNSVTAYVSKVKKGGTAKDNDIDEKTVNSAVKTVKYNGNDIYFYAKNTNLEPLDKGKKHTLTMYYMERGMWESNMAVAFNFPDNNELQVQKIVDKKDVNEWFKSCFDTPDLFAFTIQNQATHYQNPQHDATIDSDENLIKLNTSNYASCKPVENSKGIIFEPTTALDGEEALHWYAQYPDTNPPSGRRSERYGILTLNDAINISQKRYLTFKIYAKSESDQGVLSLGNLYLELLDKNKKQKGCLGTTCLNGTTYGTVTLENDKWITIKLDLNKLNAEEGFDLTQVTTIRVGDNYPRHIYFKDFVFSAQAKATTKTGFTTKQEDIPVYGSINAGGLTNAAGAQFTTTKNNDTHVVDENGQFMLQNGETVTFSDQFRRGSYISLKETLNPNLYDTTWTVYENGQKVTSMKGDSTVKTVEVTDTNKSLDRQKDPADGPDDGRTEVYDPAQGIANNGYTASQKPKNANTIVFRSYKNPDETTSSLTKLKVQFVNTVKTGDLVIQKAAASDEVDLIKGKYTFNVTFTNVGGVGLEKDPIEKQVTIDMNDKDRCEISGIPIGTRFRIEEVTTNDGSHLQGVSVTGGGVDTKEVDNTYVQGSIGETDVTATFTNTMHELINIDFTKTWENANGSPLEDGLPGEIYIQLQRRKTKNDPWKPVRYPEDAKTEYVTVTPARNGWNCAFTFANLDKFDVEDHTNYEYRIVEGTLENGNFTKVEPKETIPIKGNTYVVTAKAEAKISDEDGTKKTNATVGADGTITGGSGTIVLTNKLQNPKFVLDIIKKDAELNNESKEVFLEDVEFKLEKLVETTTEGKTQWVVDENYPFDSTNIGSITGTTGKDGKITPNPFTDLKPGRYRLTETKAHPGYNLLSKSIDIEFTQDGKCSIDGVEVKKDGNTFKDGPNNTYTMTLPVLNRKTPELPHTGADAPSLWLLIGMPLAVAGLLIFTFRYNRKGGRRH